MPDKKRFLKNMAYASMVADGIDPIAAQQYLNGEYKEGIKTDTEASKRNAKAAAATLGVIGATAAAPAVFPVLMNPVTAKTAVGAGAATLLDAYGVTSGIKGLSGAFDKARYGSFKWRDVPELGLNLTTLIPGSSVLTTPKNMATAARTANNIYQNGKLAVNTAKEVKDLRTFVPTTENKVIHFTPIPQKYVSTVHFDPRVKPLSRPISEAEKSGIIKSERPFYDQKVLDTAKLFAKEYGYPEPTTIEEIKNMYRRHNTFFRTVNDIQDNGYNTKLYNSLPEGYRKLSIEEQRKVLASKGYPLAFRTGVPSDKFMDQFVFVSPTLEENARYINGSLDHTVKLQRPFSFRDPKRGYLDADGRPYPKEYLNDQYKGSEIGPKGHTEVGNANPAQELKIATDKLIPVDIAKPTDKGTRLGNYFVKRINEDEFHNIPYNSSGRAIYRRIHPKYDDAPEYSLEYLEPERNLTREYPVFPELQDNYILKYLQSQGFKLPIKKQGGILKAQDGVPEIYGGELNPAVVKPKPVRFILRTDPITKNTPITHSSMKADPINKEDLGFFISKGSDDTTYNLIHANCSDATGECLEVLTGQDFTSGITTPISVSRKVRKVFEKQPEYTESGGGLFNSREQSFVVPWYDYRKAKDLHNETVLNSLLKKYSQDKRIHGSKEREDAIIKNGGEQHPKLKYDLDENNNVVNPSKR